MPTPTPSQKSAAWLCITMDADNHRILLSLDPTHVDHQRVVRDWGLNPSAVEFVRTKMQRLVVVDPTYRQKIVDVANGFKNLMVAGGDWGDPTCPDKRVTKHMGAAKLASRKKRPAKTAPRVR